MKLEWNTGGWFGGQIGGTAWILVAAALSSVRDMSTGLILLLIFTVPNIIGYIFWHRQKLSVYSALQLLFGLMGVCSLLAIYVLDRSQLWREIQVGSSISALSGYFIVAIVFAAVMLMFYVRFGRNEDGSAT